MEASFLSMVSVIYGWLAKSHACSSGLFCLGFSFCVLLFRYTERMDVLGRTGHGCTPSSPVRCRWSSFLVICYSMDIHHPCCCQGLQGEVFPSRPLSQSSGKPELRSWLVLQTSIKTLNLINNSGEKQFAHTSLRGRSCLRLHGPDFGQPNSKQIPVLRVSCGWLLDLRASYAIQNTKKGDSGGSEAD